MGLNCWRKGFLSMLFLIVGVLAVLLKWLGVEPVASASWFWVLLPFGLAAAWWAWADGTGYTQRKAMQRMDEKKAARREKVMEALGQLDRNKKKGKR